MKIQAYPSAKASVALSPDELTIDEIVALRDAIIPDSARQLDHLMEPTSRSAHRPAIIRQP